MKDGLNWYAYAGNNPVMFADPLGLYNESALKMLQDAQALYATDSATASEMAAEARSMLAETAQYIEGWGGYDSAIWNAIDAIVHAGVNGNSAAEVQRALDLTKSYWEDYFSAEKWQDALVFSGLTALTAVLIRGGAAVIEALVANLIPAAMAVDQASKVNTNDLHHIFGKVSHGLDPLVNQMGSQVNVYNAVQQAAQAQVTANGLTGIFQGSTGPISVQVAGYSVGVYGNVMDGVLKITTFFMQ